jgi:hypothetical protein
MFFHVAHSITICAQEKYNICLEPDNFIINDRKFFISSAIDNRNVRKGIGIVNKGFDNIQVPADFCEPFEAHLSSYFQKSLPQLNVKQLNLIAVVEEFKIKEEISGLSEKGSVDVHFSFCIETDNKLMKVFDAKSHKQNQGLDVTLRHDDRIKKAIYDCIRQLYQSDLQIDKATELILDNENTDAGNTEKRRGIYANIDELLSGNSTDQSEFSIHHKDEFFYLIHKTTGKMDKKAFGFCDGRYLYINRKNYSHNRLYAKVLTEGRYLAWIDHYVSNSEVVIGSTLGNSTYNSMASGFDLVVLDTQTGIISIMNKGSLGNLLRQAPVIYEEYKQTNIANNVAKQINFIKRLNNYLKFNQKDDN